MLPGGRKSGSSFTDGFRILKKKFFTSLLDTRLFVKGGPCFYLLLFLALIFLLLFAVRFFSIDFPSPTQEKGESKVVHKEMQNLLSQVNKRLDEVKLLYQKQNETQENLLKTQKLLERRLKILEHLRSNLKAPLSPHSRESTTHPNQPVRHRMHPTTPTMKPIDVPDFKKEQEEEEEEEGLGAEGEAEEGEGEGEGEGDEATDALMNQNFSNGQEFEEESDLDVQDDYDIEEDDKKLTDMMDGFGDEPTEIGAEEATEDEQLGNFLEENDDNTIENDGSDVAQPMKESLGQEQLLAKPSSSENSRLINEERRQAVRKALLHAWNSYKKYAWGADELRPVSKGYQTWVEMGLTIVDSLDSLWIMDFKPEFKEGRDWVAKHLTFDKQNRMLSVFETTIRVLGGLLSAYELSGDSMFLHKAKQLGDKLLLAFPDDSSIPYASLNIATGDRSLPGWTANSAILSEIGTLQLEFLYLARRTNLSYFAEKPLQVIKMLDELPKDNGHYYLYLEQYPPSWAPQRHSSLGALGDSFYEYLLKLWLMTGKKVPGYLRMYDSAMEAVIRDMIKKSSPNSLTYLAELQNSAPYNKMDHLACFAGGMFALGEQGMRQGQHLKIGAEITRTCHEFYARTATGIAPEYVIFESNDFFIPPNGVHNLLRPETVESYFVLWRVTHDQKYRDWGWEAFQAWETYSRLDSGYSGVRDVTQTSNIHYDDLQQTFFLAESLKYLFLLFSEDDVIPIDKFVFNTEAHPLSVFDDVEHWPASITKRFPNAKS